MSEQILSAVHGVTTMLFWNLLFCIFSWDQTDQKKYPDYVSVIFRAGTVICN